MIQKTSNYRTREQLKSGSSRTSHTPMLSPSGLQHELAIAH